MAPEAFLIGYPALDSLRREAQVPKCPWLLPGELGSTESLERSCKAWQAGLVATGALSGGLASHSPEAAWVVVHERDVPTVPRTGVQSEKTGTRPSFHGHCNATVSGNIILHLRLGGVVFLVVFPRAKHP